MIVVYEFDQSFVVGLYGNLVKTLEAIVDGGSCSFQTMVEGT